MDAYYDLEYTKAKLREYFKKGLEVELCIKIGGEDYMIIPLKTNISFQWIGVSKEFFYPSVDALFEATLINNINLNNDWHKIEEIWFY